MDPWNIPGTVLTVRPEETQYIEEKFRSMFLGGGMVLSQIAGVTGLESYTVQNWVKRGFLTKPENKRYTLRQLCRIININMLKPALPMEEICGLLQYINGNLDDESDDLIDDSQLYFLFVRLAANHRQMKDPAGRDAYLDEALAEYCEPIPGAKERVKKVLRIMLTAWAAAQLRTAAETMVAQLKTEE
ncbi:MAG: DUF1836 domain-containing protein [Oscillospiraceae bacterium]|nr:DUF1836 domain-containing protein [Oscillospiraceae bacterium]